MTDPTVVAESRALADARRRYIAATREAGELIDLDLLGQLDDYHHDGAEPSPELAAWLAEWVDAD